MMQNKTPYLNKYSDEAIEQLINQASNLRKVSTPLSSVPKATGRKRSPNFFLIAIPFAIILFSLSALYLQKDSSIDTGLDKQRTTSNMSMLEHKMDLLKNSSIGLLKVDDTLQELLKLRQDHLNDAKNLIVTLLDENQIAPVENLEEKLHSTLKEYLNIEHQEKLLLSTSINDLFRQIYPYKKKDIYLFKRVLEKKQLNNYLPIQMPPCFKISGILENFTTDNFQGYIKSMINHELEPSNNP
jgi:hypothetical protein